MVECSISQAYRFGFTTDHNAYDVKLERMQFDRNGTDSLPTSTIDVPMGTEVMIKNLHRLSKNLPTPSCMYSMLAQTIPKLTDSGSHTLFDLSAPISAGNPSNYPSPALPPLWWKPKDLPIQ